VKVLLDSVKLAALLQRRKIYKGEIMNADTNLIRAEAVTPLKSPIEDRANRLKPLRSVALKPYYGSKRSIKLFRTHYLIGSGEDCDIKIDDPFVSPAHAELRLLENGEGYFITDLDSRNGVFLNGLRVKSAPLPSQGNLRLGRSSFAWREAAAELESDGEWIVADPFMRETVVRLKRMAKSNLPVMLLGETGTGKEILARLLHNASNRPSGPYVPVNGALTGGALAESELFGHQKGAFTGAETARMGALRSAHGGTLFLDEVADIPASAQVKLLRALEAGEVKSLGSDAPVAADFRLVSATSQNLEEAIEAGRFRLDLYYRLAGFVVHVPPLRDRPLDILAIAAKFLEKTGLDLHRESDGVLLSYRWPGNVRELRSCLGRAVVLAKAEGIATVLPEHFIGLNRAVVIETNKSRPLTLEEMEKRCIQASLERNGWSRGISARELGIARSTLFEKMKKFRIRDQAAAE
jgi:DNA-binding NtrC family response regulator